MTLTPSTLGPSGHASSQEHRNVVPKLCDFIYVVLPVRHNTTVVVPRFPPFNKLTNASGPFSKPWNRFTHGLSVPLTIILRSSALAAAASACPTNRFCMTVVEWQDEGLIQRTRHHTPVADEKALHRHAVIDEQPRHAARAWSGRRGIVL